MAGFAVYLAGSVSFFRRGLLLTFRRFPKTLNRYFWNSSKIAPVSMSEPWATRPVLRRNLVTEAQRKRWDLEALKVGALFSVVSDPAPNAVLFAEL